jgi:hypothetical protein
MRSCLPLAWCAAALLVLAPGAAAADPPAKAAPAAPAAPKALPKLPAKAAPAAAKPAAAPAKAVAKRGGKGAKKKAAADAPVTGGPIATYPGFRMLDGGGSRVLVALSSKVSVTETKSEGKLTYHIAGVHVPTRTNKLPLLTSFFSTPVSRAELVERDSGADLVIDLRETAAPQYRVVETDKGAELQVDFPKVASEGDAKDDAATTSTAAAPQPTGRPATTKSLDSKSNTAY